MSFISKIKAIRSSILIPDRKEQKKKKSNLIDKCKRRFQKVLNQDIQENVPVSSMPPSVLKKILKKPDFLEELVESGYQKTPFDSSQRSQNFEAGNFSEILSSQEVVPIIKDVRKKAERQIDSNLDTQTKYDQESSPNHMPEAVRQHLETDEVFLATQVLFGDEKALEIHGLKPRKLKTNNELILHKEGECRFGIFSIECGKCEHCIEQIKLNKQALDELEPIDQKEEEFEWFYPTSTPEDLDFKIKIDSVIDEIRQINDRNNNEYVNESTNENWEDEIQLGSQKSSRVATLELSDKSEIKEAKLAPLLIKEIQIDDFQAPQIDQLEMPFIANQIQPQVLKGEESESSADLSTENIIQEAKNPESQKEEPSLQKSLEILLKENGLSWISKHVKKQSLFTRFKSNFTQKLSWKSLPKKILSSLILGGSIYTISQVITPILLTGIVSKTTISLLSLLIAKSTGLSFSYQVIKDLEFNKEVDLWSENAKLQNKLIKAIEQENILQAQKIIQELQKLNKNSKIYDQISQVKELAKSKTYKKMGIMSLISAGLVGGIGLASTFEGSQILEEGKTLVASAFSKGKSLWQSLTNSNIPTQAPNIDNIVATNTTEIATSNTPTHTIPNNQPELVEEIPSQSKPQIAAEVVQTPAPIHVTANLSELPRCELTQIQQGQRVCVNTSSSKLLARSEDLQSVAKRLARGAQAVLTGNSKQAISNGITATYVEVTSNGESLWVVQNFLTAA